MFLTWHPKKSFVFRRLPNYPLCRLHWGAGLSSSVVIRYTPGCLQGFLGPWSAAQGTPTSSRVSSRGCYQHQPRSPTEGCLLRYTPKSNTMLCPGGSVASIRSDGSSGFPREKAQDYRGRPGPPLLLRPWAPWDARGDSLQALNPRCRCTKQCPGGAELGP